MSTARIRRRAVAFARHMNRVTALNAHSVSWSAVRMMKVQDGGPWYYVRRYGAGGRG